MRHESFDTKLETSDTDITFEKIYKKEYIPTEYLDDIKKANFLILPNERFRDEKGIFFPETTRQLFEYIKEFSTEDIIADIAVSDNDFQQLELHSAVVEVATIIVQWVIIPVTTSIIASFLYDLIKKYHRSPDEITAKVKIIIEENKNKKSKMITYEGPVSGVKDSLEQATKNLFSEDQNDN